MISRNLSLQHEIVPQLKLRSFGALCAPQDDKYGKWRSSGKWRGVGKRFGDEKKVIR
jgi:hypothetical protein